MKYSLYIHTKSQAVCIHTTSQALGIRQLFFSNEIPDKSKKLTTPTKSSESHQIFV